MGVREWLRMQCLKTTVRYPQQLTLDFPCDGHGERFLSNHSMMQSHWGRGGDECRAEGEMSSPAGQGRGCYRAMASPELPTKVSGDMQQVGGLGRSEAFCQPQSPGPRRWSICLHGWMSVPFAALRTLVMSLTSPWVPSLPDQRPSQG